MREYINNGWHFGTEEVRLPHTVKELPLHYFSEQAYQMVSTYEKRLQARPEWKNKRVFVTFEGVAHKAEVFLNNVKVGEHACGYTAFTVELTDVLCYDKENRLVVSVDSRESVNVPPFGFVVDYLTYGGIYRDVYLEVKEPVFVEDVFVRTTMLQQEKKQAELLVDVTVSKGCGSDTLRMEVLDEQQVIATAEIATQEGVTTYQKNLSLSGIEAWELEHPKLYSLRTTLLSNGEEKQIRFGIRTVAFRAEGFYLNGKKRKLRGLNRHQSYPYVGYAMPKRLQEWDAELLKWELGLNAVRTSHYPQSQYFIDRCDELGLLVFTEIPGWQHIGDEAWKAQAVKNVEEMILQYRNHPSIFLWGVRINESQDDEEFYRRTNETAHRLDDSRPTGGVRAHARSQLLEDVYTYNDFVHSGNNEGCQPKKKVTSDMRKGYLISEYNGHMYPTKMFDKEDVRKEQALRHIRVLEDVAGQEDIAGSFGWCMFDYNTHKDFGSGDRICYHGVMDMFRNPKPAALMYACQQERIPVLDISSSMDIGEHPASNRGITYIYTNADSVRMYKNDVFIKEYQASDSPYKHVAHGPIVIDDFIGNQIHEREAFTKHQADIIKDALNFTALHGYGPYPPSILWKALQCLTIYHMKMDDAVALYNRYIGDWGGAATSYRFEAIKDGKVVKTVVKEPVNQVRLQARVSHSELVETTSYDVAAVQILAVDQNGNQVFFANEPLTVTVEGDLELIGDSQVGLSGGATGVYIKSIGRNGSGKLRVFNPQLGELILPFTITGCEV
ncbi:beta-galactosidase [Lachnospiraceae bacterium XBB1006]|nr:beta-galactosidase [Lachnospiraceae bacterium XBB1006]